MREQGCPAHSMTRSLLGGRTLVTLEDAGNYITKLPEVEHEASGWQDAMEALIRVVRAAGLQCSPGSAS
jgi:hypothetical protein